MMESTLNEKQIQEVQELKLVDSKNSKIEIQYIQTHWNKVPKRRDFKRSKGLSLSSKVRVLRSCQTNHIKHVGTVFHIVDRLLSKPISSSKKKRANHFSALPPESQTPQKLHSIKHKKTYNGAKDHPQIPHHNNTSNTY